MISLHKHGGDFVIKVDRWVLMDSRVHSSEEALATIGCGKIQGLSRPSILIGGLGMGYTLAAALGRVGPDAKVFVAELMPAVVEWNRGPISHLAGHPLRDKRVTVLQEDVAAILRREHGAYDAILQDVDNGPDDLALERNHWLYSEAGLAAAAAALRPGGVLAVWSTKTNRGFLKSLQRAGFDAEVMTARGRDGRGAHYLVWVGTVRAPGAWRKFNQRS